MKWSFIAKPPGIPRYLLCNADESEPGTFKDRYLMEFIPHLLLEGLIVSSFALGSNATYIYIRGEYAWIAEILEYAIEEAKANGFLGKNILGSGSAPVLYARHRATQHDHAVRHHLATGRDHATQRQSDKSGERSS